LWNAGRDELKKRIEQIDACAQFFGGREKALKALGQIKAQMGNLPDPAIAAIKGNNVTLDSTRFVETGDSLKVARFDRIEGAATIYATRILDLSGVIFAAFTFGHEFGHKRKSYDKQNDNDGGDDLKVSLNSEKLRAACFPELAAP
jgi:hypothetical protein